MRVKFLNVLILIGLALWLPEVAQGSDPHAVASSQPAGDAVVLRSAASVSPGKITLGQIATLQGGQSEALSGVVIADDLSQIPNSRVTIDAVMEIVHAASAARRGSINAGRIAFHGSVCLLTRGAAIETEVNPTAPEPAGPTMPPIPEGEMVRGVVAERLPVMLGLDPSRTRLTFDDADRRLLSGLATGQKIDLKVLALADRVPVLVSIYSEHKPGEYTLGNSTTIRVGVEVERTVVTTVAPMKRGDVIESSHITTQTEWLTLTKKPLEAGEAVGSVVKVGKVGSGMALMSGDVEPAVVIRKGQVVTVHCISGPFIIKTQARALESGRIGQIIKFAPMDVRDRKDTRNFLAKVETSARAIMSVGSEAADSGR
jgi:flagella basal body P-ring formation protein FlgA